MSSYTTYDFTETLKGLGIPRGDVVRVHAATGEDGDLAEWRGAFLLELRSGKWVVVSGWCDTTGWGCQDGTEIHEFDNLIAAVDYWVRQYSDDGWDNDPADLNNYVRTGQGEWE